MEAWKGRLAKVFWYVEVSTLLAFLHGAEGNSHSIRGDNGHFSVAGGRRGEGGQWRLCGGCCRYLRSRIVQGRKLDFERDQYRLFGCGQSLLRGGSVQAGGIEPADQSVAQRGRLEHDYRAQGQDQPRSDWHRKIWLFILCGRPVRRADRGKPHRVRGCAGNVPAF